MEKIDHRKFGQRFGLFDFSESSPGFVLWHPHGMTLYRTIVEDLRNTLLDLGYHEIKTPTLFNKDLFEKSGHIQNFQDRMLFAGGVAELQKAQWPYAVKPMNCPEAMLIFNQSVRSYRNLPLRLMEFGQVYRYEQAGEVNGLFRTREFTIDDAHIFCREDQVQEEIEQLVELRIQVYRKYGFKKFSVELSTRPKKSIGTDEQWTKAEENLIAALKKKEIQYKENPGEGAFYGPKIDVHIEDAHGRKWQLGTTQLDFAMPERLSVFYTDAYGKKKHPVIIHRAILGSVERFIAILLEHYAGELPEWLAPVQARVIPVSEKYLPYVRTITSELRKNHIRTELDESQETLAKKIRQATIDKIPYILVAGQEEEQKKMISVRSRKGDEGKVAIASFVEQVTKQTNV